MPNLGLLPLRHQAYPWPGAILPPVPGATPAQEGARCAVCDRPQHPHPLRRKKKACAAQGPVVRNGTSPLGALLQCPQRGMPAGKSVRSPVNDSPPDTHAPRPRNKGGGPGLQAEKTGNLGGQRASSRTTGKEGGRAQKTPKTHNTRACAEGLVTGPRTRTLPAQRKRAAGPGRPTEGRAVGAGRVLQPRHPSTLSGNRKETRGPPPACNSQQAEQETHAGNAEGYKQLGTDLPAPCKVISRRVRGKKQGKGEHVNIAGARARKHTTDMRPATEGQPDRARRRHRPHGMAYQKARARETLRGQPATSTTSDAREGQQVRGGQESALARPSRPAESAVKPPTGRCTR